MIDSSPFAKVSIIFLNGIQRDALARNRGFSRV